jgi:hypothetical protein
MAIVANVRVGSSPRSAAGTRPAERPDVVRPARRRPTYTDGRRPARLAPSPLRSTAQPCAPRPVTGSIGWLVVAGVLAFLVVLGIGWSMGGAPDAGSVPASTVLVQVHQGETLWGVAQRLAPSSAPTAVVAKIRQLNSLDADSVLYPGELLKVPSGLTAAAAAKAGALQH